MATPPEILHRPSILIVDDQPSNLLTLSEILDREGFVVRQAIDGETALDTVRAISPDLILLDVRMPEMDGYEVCARLKADRTTCRIPIIFLSALDDALDKTRAFSTGGADYISKPFQIEEVLVRIRHQLTLQEQQRQLLDLNQQLQSLNASLEHQVRARTLELEQALSFEQTLKRISDQVRDTLDSHRILQTAIVELATALEVHGCEATLYSSDTPYSSDCLTATIRYQYTQVGQVITQGKGFPIDDIPDLYKQLYQKHWFAFCQRQPTPLWNHSAILVCPIFNDQVEQTGILGDLWLFKPTSSSFSTQEVHLVEQVANQCAIALRQSQLYDAAQRQVWELERLNQLKDDFLSTISHELRSPLSNMKMALQMLDLLTQQGQDLVAQCSPAAAYTSKAPQYFEILKQECDRELQLVTDLLDLQHLEAGNHVSTPVTITLHEWLLHLVEVFQIRALNQQQTLLIQIEDSIPALTVDLPGLTRVMTELLTNACKYTPPQETITVSTASKGDWLCLRVINTGVDIPPEELGHIFEKFYRIPNNDPWRHGGTGLGLALTRKWVEQLGGCIEVTSKNRQICFTVWLPGGGRPDHHGYGMPS